MKVAVINTGSTNNRKGSFNNVQERIKHLQIVNGVEVDAYLIRHYDDFIFRLLRKKNDIREEISEVDGVKYNNLWVEQRMYEYILTYKFYVKDMTCKSQLKKFLHYFKNYDLLSVHSFLDMYLAYLVKHEYGIPFVNTWHGSDINVWPFRNKKAFLTTKLLLENADYNFFVSKQLMNTSDKITIKGNKDYLYTGPSDNFFNLIPNQKYIFRKKLNITTKYLIGFIGNIVSIKNVMILPDIFKLLNNKIKDVSYIIVGDGELLSDLKDKLKKLGVNNVKFTGKLKPELIPEVISSFDILLLPSKNEGMPRVTLEAQACDVHVIGSDVGGIPESIGPKNTFSLDDNFVENVTNRIIEIIKTGEAPKPLSEEFSWDKAVEKEINVYKSIIRQ